MEYRTKRLLFAAVIAFSLVLSCGDTAEEPTAEETGPDTIEVAVTDTLGLLFGDSAFVFGTITQASWGGDGNVYVMDGQLGRIAVFSPQRELVRYIGRLGSGPGEFQYPQSFAFLDDGRLVVADWGTGSIVFFDSTLNFIDQLTGYYPSSPRYLVPGPGGSSYVALCMELDEGGDEITGSSFIARYARGMEPEHKYDSWPLMIRVYGDPEDPDLSIGRVDHDFDTDLQGTVYLAERDDSTYLVEAFPADGSIDTLVVKPWERVEKTQEQLEQQFYEEGRSTDNDGSGISRRTIDDIYPWLNAISSVDVDVNGDIWVGQGYTDMPTFEVYSPSGELRYVAVIPELEGARGLEYCFRNGYLAYDRQPEDYPKVYFLEPGI